MLNKHFNQYLKGIGLFCEKLDLDIEESHEDELPGKTNCSATKAYHCYCMTY